MVKDRGVHVILHKSFFDNIFEPARRKLEKQKGIKVGHLDFTKFLAKKQIKFKLPKQKINIKSKPPIKRKFKII